MVQLSHAYMTTWKIIAFTIRTFVGKVMSLLFLYALEVCHSFPSKEQAPFNFMPTVIIHSDLGAQENKICHCFHFFPICSPWSDGPDAMIVVFWKLSFKPAFSLSSFTLIKRIFSSSSLSATRVMSSIIWLSVPIRKGNQDRHAYEEGYTETQQGESHLHARESHLRRNQHRRYLAFRLVASRTVRICFCVLSRMVCGALLWQP